MVSRIAPLTLLCSGVVPVRKSWMTPSFSHLPIPVSGSGVVRDELTIRAVRRPGQPLTGSRSA